MNPEKKDTHSLIEILSDITLELSGLGDIILLTFRTDHAFIALHDFDLQQISNSPTRSTCMLTELDILSI